MKAPIRQLVEALDRRLHFLPYARIRQSREYNRLHSPEVRAQMLHYGAWVNFWGISCFIVTLIAPLSAVFLFYVQPHSCGVSYDSIVRFLLCFPAVILAVKFAGDAFICLAANAVQRLAPGAGCSVKPQPWKFRELRAAYAWYCGVPHYWVRRFNRISFLMAALGVCIACCLV